MVGSHKNPCTDVRGTRMEIYEHGFLSVHGREKTYILILHSCFGFFFVIVSPPLSSALLPVLAFHPLTSFYNFSPSIRLIAKQQ